MVVFLTYFFSKPFNNLSFFANNTANFLQRNENIQNRNKVFN